MEKLPVYHVRFYNQFGFAVQPVKAANKRAARAKFRSMSKKNASRQIVEISLSGKGQIDRFINRHAR